MRFKSHFGIKNKDCFTPDCGFPLYSNGGRVVSVGMECPELAVGVGFSVADKTQGGARSMQNASTTRTSYCIVELNCTNRLD